MRNRALIFLYVFLLTRFLTAQIALPFQEGRHSHRVSGAYHCDQVPGSDMGAKIVNCVASSRGIADASQFSGEQTSTDSITISKPVLLKLGSRRASLRLAAGKQIVISSDNVTIQCARGFTIIQGAAGTDLIFLKGVKDFRIENCTLQGSPAPIPASPNDAIHIISATGVHVANNKIIGFRQNAAYAEKSSDVWYVKNEVAGNSASLRFCGVQRGFIQQNTIHDPQTPNDIFTIAIAIDSHGSSCPGAQNSRDIHVEGNTIRHFVNAQAIDFHDCMHCTATGNIMDDVLIGVSANPFQSGDIVSDVTITKNTYEGTVTPGAASSTGNACIAVGGGPGGLRVTHSTVTGNICDHANAVVHSEIQGGITVGYADDVVVAGNAIRNSVGIGISLYQPNTRLLISKNKIMDTILCCGSQQFGIYAQAVQTGRIEGNIVDFTNQGSKGAAYRFDVASPGLLFGKNDARNVEKRIMNGNNVTLSKE